MWAARFRTQRTSVYTDVLKFGLSNSTMFPSPDTEGDRSSVGKGAVPPGTTEISSAGAAAIEKPSPTQPKAATANRPASTHRLVRPRDGPSSHFWKPPNEPETAQPGSVGPGVVQAMVMTRFEPGLNMYGATKCRSRSRKFSRPTA